jgi:hypothetical protein
MKRPKQLPAVDRGMKTCASVSVSARVSPCGFWDQIIATLNQPGGIVARL